MQSIKSTNSKRKLSRRWIMIIAVLATALLAAGVVTYTYIKGNNDKTTLNDSKSENSSSNKVNYDPPTNEEKAAGDKQKSESVNAEPSTDQSNNLDVTFSAVNQNDDVVQIRTMIQGVIQGSCSLTVVNGSQSKTFTSSTQLLANASTCSGFDISTSDIGTGKWDIKLTVTSNDNAKKGETTTMLTVK